MKKETVLIHGKHEFTASEMDKMKSELPEVLHRLQRFEAAKARAAKKLKEKADALKEQIADLSAKIRSGHEFRLIECVMQLDPVKRERVFRAADTLREVKREPFKPEDHQMRMVDNVHRLRGEEATDHPTE